MSYKLTTSKGITSLPNGASLPARWENGALVELDPDSPLVKELRAWIVAGNTPEPADQPSAAEVAALAAGKSLDAALSADTTLAQLKAMTNTEFDAWWLANVTTAAQAIQVLKRLAKLAIRRLA